MDFPGIWVSSVLGSQLIEEEDGTLWFPAVPYGLYMYEPSTGTIKNFRHDPEDPQSLSSDIVENVILDDDGSLWIATWDGGLNKLIDKYKGTFEHFRHDPEQSNSIYSDSLVCMLIDRSGELWIAGRKGFSKYIAETNSFQSYRVRDSYFPHRSSGSIGFSEIIEDPDGYLWFRSYGHYGAFYFDPATERLYQFIDLIDQEGGLEGANWPFKILIDRVGLVWVITEGGVNIIEKTQNKPFYHFSHEVNNPNSINHTVVTSIYLDKGNTLWAGSHGGVLNRWDHFIVDALANFRQYSPFEREYAPELVTTIAEDYNKTLWLGA